MSKIAAIIGRIFLGVIFIVSGAGKLMDVAGTEAQITGVGLPGGFAIGVGLFELVAGLCLAAGLMVRLVAILLFLFVAATTLFYHNEFTDPLQSAMALKNVAIMGGLLLAFAQSQMWSHYYSITRERKGELAALEAEKRVHDAEIRAARAEGIAAGTAPAATGAIDGGAHADGYPVTTRSRWRHWFDW